MGHVMDAGAHFVQILEVTADDAAYQDAQAFHRVEAGMDPVAGVGAGANAPPNEIPPITTCSSNRRVQEDQP